jgi:hypothetical protein
VVQVKIHGDQFVIVFRDEFRRDTVQDLAAEAAQHFHLSVARPDSGEEAPFGKPPSNSPSTHDQGGPHRCSTYGGIDGPAAYFQAVISRQPHFIQ